MSDRLTVAAFYVLVTLVFTFAVAHVVRGWTHDAPQTMDSMSVYV